MGGLEDEELAEEEARRIFAEIEREELLPEGIADQNRGLVERQRRFRRAADILVETLAAFPEVRAITLFGSVAVPLWKEIPRFSAYRRAGIALWHECKDVDLAVWLDRLDTLPALRRAVVSALPRIFQEEGKAGVPPHEIELFLFEPGTNRHLGRLCRFKKCRAGKPDCLAPGCGNTPFLKQVPDFRLYADALAPERTLRLFDRPAGIVARAVDLPGPPPEDRAERRRSPYEQQERPWRRGRRRYR